MQFVKALALPLDKDLSPLLALLNAQQIMHRVIEHAGQQELWILQAQQQQVEALYQAWQAGELTHTQTYQRSSLTRPVLGQLKRAPMTTTVLILTALVALITQVGENFHTLSYFSFTDFYVQAPYLYFSSLNASLESGQWWRLISPILIHFGFLHLAMNSLWFWELGKRIEWRHGGLFLLLLTLVAGGLSNYAQYFFSGPSLFGGLSGVLYALLGYCWLYQRQVPSAFTSLPKGVVVMMLAWLVLCLTGIVTWLGFGAIANAAHVSGLIVGCLAGAVGGWRAKQQQVR